MYAPPWAMHIEGLLTSYFLKFCFYIFTIFGKVTPSKRWGDGVASFISSSSHRTATPDGEKGTPMMPIMPQYFQEFFCKQGHFSRSGCGMACENYGPVKTLNILNICNE